MKYNFLCDERSFVLHHRQSNGFAETEKTVVSRPVVDTCTMSLKDRIFR